MQLVESITLEELRAMAEERYGDFVKAVADVEQELLVLDADLHADEEQYLLERGSRQQDLWGFNLYPDDFGTEDFIEFDSLINIRPRQSNRSRSVEDPELRDLIREIVRNAIHE